MADLKDSAYLLYYVKLTVGTDEMISHNAFYYLFLLYFIFVNIQS